MSVVCLVMNEAYSVIMGDTKLTNNPDLTEKRKIFKKEDVLLGYTGDLTQIHDYLHPIFNNDMTLNNDYLFNDKMHLIHDLDERFYSAVEKGEQSDVILVLSLKLGNKYIGKRYCLIGDINRPFQSETFVATDQATVLFLGESIHEEFFYNVLAQKQTLRMEDFVKAFQCTIDEGCKIDDGINNILQYEYL